MRIMILFWSIFFAVTASAQEEALRFQRAYEQLDRYVAQSMQQNNTPGVSLALTGRNGLLYLKTYGFANLDAKQPVTPDTLFEIGSISKSFTAISLLQLRDEGKFDPHAPVSSYIPWFSLRTKYRPITAHDLLSHTAAIPQDRDDIPSSVFQAVALRERSTGDAPGRHFYYSNIGYQVLGYALEAIEQKPYPDIVRKRILEPLGMKSTEPAIIHELRRRLAVGYETLYDDRPARLSDPLVPATWIEYGAGDGSISSTPADLAIYLRMLLNHGAGPDGKRILSEEGFRLFMQRVIEEDEEDDSQWYGYGMGIEEKDGCTILNHSGGMLGYSSMLAGDVTDGLGVIVFVNGPGEAGEIAEYAMELLHAALQNHSLPCLSKNDRYQVENAKEYAGTFISRDERSLIFEEEGEHLVMKHKKEKIVLEPRGKDYFLAEHPDFALFLLHFGRKDEKVVEVGFGRDWYRGEAYNGPVNSFPPKAWEEYAGHYRSQQPWFTNFRVVSRNGSLIFIAPNGYEEPLAPIQDGEFRVSEKEWMPERLRFDALITFWTSRANLSGVDYYRTFTP